MNDELLADELIITSKATEMCSGNLVNSSSIRYRTVHRISFYIILVIIELYSYVVIYEYLYSGMHVCHRGFITSFRGQTVKPKIWFRDDVAMVDMEVKCHDGEETLSGVPSDQAVGFVRPSLIIFYVASKFI